MKHATKHNIIILIGILTLIVSYNSKILKKRDNPQNSQRGRNVCSFGKAQSPINFSNSPKIMQSPLINIKYDNIKGNLEWRKNSYRIKVNKQLNSQQYIVFTSPDGKFKKNFYLNSVKFKVPAEHQINNYHPKLEIQFVHTSSARDDSNPLYNFKRLTLSLLLDDDPNNPTGDHFLSSLNIDASNVIKDLIQEVQSSGYFLYYGSLTEEPCTENNIWIVLTKTFTIGSDFLKGMNKLTHEINNGNDNARKTNDINEREIWLYGKAPEQKGTFYKQ